ncbi:MAG: penicillin-binding protein 1C [Thiotrichaceae bacterium]|nr:penicillin-binding protein 1C [Thiotrichaceae bacterium]
MKYQLFSAFRIRVIRVLTLLLLLTLSILFWFSLPNTLFDRPISTLLLDEKGHLLGAHIASDEQWRFPAVDKLPEKFVICLTQFEDKRFAYHLGVDPLAVARAFKLNLQQGRVVSGGSTLTMQLIRLSRNNKSRTIGEKLVEMMLALRLELSVSKDEILRQYATHAPFGGNIVGLETASWRYFGRRSSQLSWAESATLAVLPNSPALIHPGRRSTALLKKRNALLKRLNEKGLIDHLSYELATIEKLPLRPKPLPRLAAHLLDTLRLQQGSKTITSTLDKSLQQKVQNVIYSHAEKLRSQSIHNIAALVIDNRTFQVKAYIGNANNKQTGNQGYAIDLVHRRRSSGSTLKPFLFANMIQAGDLLPETLISDVPVRYAGFRPQNYDRKFNGAVRAKEALARSLNIPAANMLSQYGVGRFQADLQNMGLRSLHRNPKDYGLTLILGGAEATLWEITSLYANLAKLAQQPHRNSMEQWQSPKVLAKQVDKFFETTGMSPASAWMTIKALLEVTRPGTAGFWRKFSSSRKVAWKTGTSFGHRDAWAIGMTPQYTVGVWVGNANGIGVNGLTGVSSAAPILFDIFNRLPRNGQWFTKPSHQMKTINICKNDGYLVANGCASHQYDVPRDSFFDKLSPYHQRLHLDATERWQVNSRCEPVQSMQHKSWFILPPDQAHFYQQNNADYQAPPLYRKDCLQNRGKGVANSNPISLIYPKRHTQVYIPIELDGKAGKVVFKAIHRIPEKRLYWHIDDQYLGSTQVFHEQAVWLKGGKHQLILVDEDGYRRERWFRILEK